MILREDIRSAGELHDEWSGRIRSAIDGAASGCNPEYIQKSGECQLGQWLLAVENPSLRSCECYSHCVDAHERFHEMVGTLMQRATAGDLSDPDAELGPDSEFSRDLIALVEAVQDWSQHAAIGTKKDRQAVNLPVIKAELVSRNYRATAPLRQPSA